MQYIIESRIPGAGLDKKIALCFDPTIVIARLMESFPNEVVVCIHDYAWKDYDAFHETRASLSAINAAEIDARRRGPNFIFRVRTGTDQIVQGNAERYIIRIWSDRPISDDLKSRFISFLNSMTYYPYEVSSCCLNGNHREEI